MEGQHVILYLDEIDKVSFSFKIYQSAVVKETKPAAVTVYDYYETGKETDWRQKGVLYGESHLLYDFAKPYSIHPKDHTPTTRPDHNTGNSVSYSFRTVHGFFYVPQNREQWRIAKRGLPFLSRTLGSLTICSCDYKGSTFYSFI